MISAACKEYSYPHIDLSVTRTNLKLPLYASIADPIMMQEDISFLVRVIYRDGSKGMGLWGGGVGVKANLTNSSRSMLRFDQLESVNVEV